MIPKYPDYSKEEFENRWEKAKDLMKKQGIDGLLITERQNYMYFTGHNSIQNRADKTRAYVFILPREGEGVLITVPYEKETVYDTSWVQDIREGGLEDHSKLICDLLKEKGLEGKVIGCELGSNQYMGLNYNTFEEIKSLLPSSKFVDGSNIVLQLRSIKSKKQIEYMRKAGSIAAEAHMETFKRVEVGMTELEVGRIFRQIVAEKGGEHLPLLQVTVGMESTGGVVLIPTPKKVVEGVVLTLDAGLEYRGMACDVCRTAFVGEPPKEARDFYKWVMKLRYECDDMLVAGNTPSVIMDHVKKVEEAKGIKRMAGIGRIGHGVGYETTEWPSIRPEGDFEFKPGMVFTCNPNYIKAPYGNFNSEDNWLITENKPELLSNPIAPAEITIVGK